MPKAPLDADGNELVDMDNTPVSTNPDGTMSLYHRTNREGADAIAKTGRFLSKENTNETFFSNQLRGPNSAGYGTHVVEARVHPRHARLNDAFHKGELHVAVSNKHLSKKNIKRIFEDKEEAKRGGVILGKAHGGRARKRADR